MILEGHVVEAEGIEPSSENALLEASTGLVRVWFSSPCVPPNRYHDDMSALCRVHTADAICTPTRWGLSILTDVSGVSQKDRDWLLSSQSVIVVVGTW